MSTALARQRGRVRSAIAARPQLAGGVAPVSLATWLCPEYPGVSLELARRVRAGASPLALAREADPACDFSRAEAHEWLMSGGSAPLAWLCVRLGRGQLRSWRVARWLQRVLACPVEREAFDRERVYRGPAGQELRVRWSDRLDEIQDEDLVVGRTTGVVAAYEHAAERGGSAYLARLEHDHRVLAQPPAWRLLQGSRARAARWLCTPADLVREGTEMNHCVGGYAYAVERGQCSILAIDVRGKRATVELSPDGVVRQFFGAHDARPPAICARWLRAFLRANGLPGIGEKWGRL